MKNIRSATKISPPKNILIQRADRLGDCILSFPVVEALHEAYPDAKLDFICSPISKSIISKHPLINTFFVWKNNTKELIKILSEHDYDLYICLWEHPELQSLGKKAGIPHQFGAFQSRLSQRHFTDCLPIKWRDYNRHQSQFNLDHLAPLNLDQTAPIYKLYPEEMGNIDITDPSSDILIFCSSGGSNAPLPVETIHTLITRLLSETSYKIRLCYGHDIPDSLRSIQNERLINMTEMTPFSDLLTLINHCRYYIGPDTGPTHMASFLNKPMVVYYSAEKNPPTRWGSQSDYQEIVRYDYLRHPFSTEKLADKLYERFLNLIDMVAKKLHVNKIFEHEKHSYRVLIPCQSKSEFKEVYTQLKPLRKSGLIAFPILLTQNPLRQLSRVHYKIKTHNIAMIHGSFPRWVGWVLHYTYGLQANFQPLWIPSPFPKGVSIMSLLARYKRDWQNCTLRCYKKDK